MFGRLNPQNNPKTRADHAPYRAAYCGLCHSLKSDYGQAATFLVTYDLAFLSLLWTTQNHDSSAQTSSSPKTETRPCTTLPWTKVQIQSPVLLRDRLLGALTIVLACQKFSDDQQDEGSVVASLGLKLLDSRLQKARDVLYEIGFSLTELDAYLANQAAAESGNYPDALSRVKANCTPTANLTRSLYHDGASLLSITPEPAKLRFAEILGRAVYLADAVEDLKKDEKSGSFNPLLGASPQERKQLRNYLHSSASELQSRWFEGCGNSEAWKSLDSCLIALGAILKSYGSQEFKHRSLDSFQRRRLKKAGFLKAHYRDGCGRPTCADLLCECICDFASQHRCPCGPEPKAIDLDTTVPAPKSLLDQKLEFQVSLPMLPHGDYTCPGCEKTPMVRVELGEGGLFHCEDCGGVWLNPLHLNELKEQAETRNYITFPQAGSKPAKAQGTRLCPSDGEILEITREKGVSVESCPHCQCWYLDPGELGSLI